MRGEEPLIEIRLYGGTGVLTQISTTYRSRMAIGLARIHGATHRLFLKSRAFAADRAAGAELAAVLEGHCRNMAVAADRISERLRALASPPMPSVTPENRKPGATPPGGLSVLIGEHEMIMGALLEAADGAGEFGDLVTEDLLSQRFAFHESAIRMLRPFKF